jgi:hypothetical protein
MGPEPGKIKARGEPIDLSKVEPRYEIEEYTPERVAEFLLNNAVGADGYAEAREEVRALGLDPDQIPHEKPPGV